MNEIAPENQKNPVMATVFCPLCDGNDLFLHKDLIFCSGCNVFVGKPETFEQSFKSGIFNRPLKQTPAYEPFSRTYTHEQNHSDAWYIITIFMLSALFLLAYLRII